MVGVGKPYATHVEALVADEIEATKAEPVLDGVKLRDAVFVERRERVSLGAVLGRTGRP